MSSSRQAVILENPQIIALESSGDLRRLMKNIAVGVMRKEMNVSEAAVAIKACEQINVSLYSEIKHAAMLVALGRTAPELGELPLFGASLLPKVSAAKV